MTQHNEALRVANEIVDEWNTSDNASLTDAELTDLRNRIAHRLAQAPHVPVSREVFDFLVEIAQLSDDEAGWTDNDIKSFGDRADRFLNDFQLPQPDKIDAAVAFDRWWTKNKDRFPNWSIKAAREAFHAAIALTAIEGVGK